MGRGANLMMEDVRRPPSRTARIMTYIALTLTVLWWLVLLAFAILAASAMAEAEWDPLPSAIFVAPALAIVSAIGSMAWLARERQSSTPILMSGVLVALSCVFTLSLYSLPLLLTLLAMMSGNPGG